MAVIYLCPADKRLLCSWEGHASEIKQHFEKEHDRLLFHTNQVEIDLNTLPENRLLYLDEEMYLLQNYIENETLRLKLRYLGLNEIASKMQYDICITINGISYKYESERYFSCVIPKAEEWEINLECLEKYHGKLDSLVCTVLIDEHNFHKRRTSDTSLRINNRYVEKNVCDLTEEEYTEALYLVDEKIKRLRDSRDFMDKISQLNFSILEEPFTNTHSPSEEQIPEELPNIPEELDLSCTSCHLDMLPPIYLCVSGHNVCSRCKSHPCKVCNAMITTSRNIALENVSRTHLHHCRYASDGCTEKYMYNQLRAHEARCQFCRYKCPSDDCPFEGRFTHFLNHLKVVHGSVKIGFSTRNDFPKNHELYVVNKAVGVFFCKSEQKNDSICWRATFCGPTERQFFCEINFKGSKYKEPIFLKRHENVYELTKPVAELKKMKAKAKYAVLSITCYDS
ncbi:hypothetical protein MTP99_015178 [Tenebrio molitor]|nr:hypothetical protein MTP99_015178 [Tenebrio molitor]